MEAVRTAKPDGYTIASATIGTLSINQYLYKKLPHNPETDFMPASLHWENCNTFMVAPDHPAKNMQELIAWSRTKPGGANIGTAGIGTSPYLAAALFKARTGIPATAVPFPGGAQSLAALMGGNIDFSIDNIASSFSLIRAGKVRALGVTAAKRSAALPGVPTMIEQGFPGFEMYPWHGVYGPANLPKEVVATLTSALSKIMQGPEARERLSTQGFEPIVSTSQQFMEFQKKEFVVYERLIREGKIRIEQ
jgi:tripartite-type tricarboxylate transporter receptor subunit TctC